MHHQHMQIIQLAQGRFIGVRDHLLDEQESAIWCHRTVAAFEDRNAMLIVPIMQDEGEQVDIPTTWHRLKKVSRDHLAALGEASGSEMRFRALAHLGRLKQDAPCVRIHLRMEARSEPCPPPTSTIVLAQEKS